MKRKLSWIVGLCLLCMGLMACQGVEKDVSDMDIYRTAYTYTVDQKAPELPSQKVDFAWVPSKKRVSLLSVGDIMGHTVQLSAAKTEDGYDFSEQFKYIEPVIASRDFAIGNLETVFAGPEAHYSGKNMIFNSPDALAETIKATGFDILTTANNHSLDRGYAGLKRTLDLLDGLAIMHAGTARDLEEAEDILTFEKEGIRFALLSYSYSTNGWPMPEDHPYALSMLEEEKIIAQIHKAKSLDVDFVLVAAHWGLEYHLDENIHQTSLTDKMFMAGADIVLGTHPHVIQPFDHVKMVDESGEEKDKFIIYSQGNFVSGQRTYPRAIGMHITFDFLRENDGPAVVDQVSVMPTYVDYQSVNYKPYMRILDTRRSVLDYEAGLLDLTGALVTSLKTYEKDFVDHIASKSQVQPYLNDRGDYVIYSRDGNKEK